MFEGGFFSFGNAGPLLLLFGGTVVVGLISSIAAIVARRGADSELTTSESQPQIDVSIAFLVISCVVSIVGAFLYHTSYAFGGIGMMLTVVGIFLLWPVSAILTLRGRGVGRGILLKGHDLIATLMSVLILAMLIHG